MSFRLTLFGHKACELCVIRYGITEDNNNAIFGCLYFQWHDKLKKAQEIRLTDACTNLCEQQRSGEGCESVSSGTDCEQSSATVSSLLSHQIAKQRHKPHGPVWEMPLGSASMAHHLSWKEKCVKPSNCLISTALKAMTLQGE